MLKLFLAMLMTVNLFGETIPEVEIPAITVLASSDEEASILVYQETTPGMRQPVVKGLMGDKINITIDNIKFSNSLFRSGPNQYYSWIPDDFILESVINETLLNSSLGGTVDVVLGVKESSVGVEVSSNTFKFLSAYKDDNISVAFVRSDNQNVVTPHDGEVQNSSWNQTGVYLEKLSDSGKTNFMYSESTDVDRTDKFEQDQYYVYDLQRYIRLSHVEQVGDYTISPTWQRFQERIDRDSESKNIKSTLDIFGLSIDRRWNNLFSHTDTLRVGVSDNYENIDYDRGTTSTHYYYNTLSAWASYQDFITDSLDYTLSYNFSYLNTSGGDIDRTMSGNSFGIISNYYMDNDAILWLALNSNVKFPTITNLAEARSDSVTEIANPNLDSEKAITLTLGFDYEHFNISIFHKELYDMIIREQTDILDEYDNYKWKYQNTDRGRIDGINLSYDKTFDDIRFQVKLEYLYGKTDYDYISKLQPFTSWTRIDWLNFYTEFLYAPDVPESKMALKDQTDYRIQGHNYGYNILNAGYLFVVDKHNIEFKLDNIFDSRGRVYGSSVDFNERRLRVEYLYKF